MSDAIFNSFLKSVYGSGSSMHLFDGHVDGGMEIVGGVDDITVESIFGIHAGDCGKDDHSEDPVDPVGGGGFTSEFSIEGGDCGKDDHSEDPVDPVGGGGFTSEFSIEGGDYHSEEDEYVKEDMTNDADGKTVQYDCISICIDPTKLQKDKPREVHAGQFTEQVNISCSGYRDNDDRSFLDDDSEQEENQKSKEPKKISSGSLTTGLTAQEVASLISIYKD